VDNTSDVTNLFQLLHCIRFKSEFHQHLQEPFQELINDGGLSNVDDTSDANKPVSIVNGFRFKSTFDCQHLQEPFQDEKQWLDYQMWIPAMRTNLFFFGCSNRFKFKSNLESPTLTGLPLGSNTKPRSFE
jgi:hypothetical protein